jgi:hypothetical protein
MAFVTFSGSVTEMILSRDPDTDADPRLNFLCVVFLSRACLFSITAYRVASYSPLGKLVSVDHRSVSRR